MVSHIQRKEVGAVGAKLLYPDNTVQHAGIILGIFGVAEHSHKYYHDNSKGYFNRPNLTLYNNTNNPDLALPYRTSIFLDMEKSLGRKSFLTVFTVYNNQAGLWEYLAGGSLGYIFNNKENINAQLGSSIRLVNQNNNAGLFPPDATTVFLRYSYLNFRIAFAYDINTSALSASTGSSGAREFVVSYLFGDRKRITCPTYL